jgi:hypothetical protein
MSGQRWAVSGCVIEIELRSARMQRSANVARRRRSGGQNNVGECGTDWRHDCCLEGIRQLLLDAFFLPADPGYRPACVIVFERTTRKVVEDLLHVTSCIA